MYQGIRWAYKNVTFLICVRGEESARAYKMTPFNQVSRNKSAYKTFFIQVPVEYHASTIRSPS